jgi:hypothetical protein
MRSHKYGNMKKKKINTHITLRDRSKYYVHNSHLNITREFCATNAELLSIVTVIEPKTVVTLTLFSRSTVDLIY